MGGNTRETNQKTRNKKKINKIINETGRINVEIIFRGVKKILDEARRN